MSPVIAGEGWFLLHSLLLGIVISFTYDLFRILRRIVPHGVIVMSLEDLVFWMCTTAGIFYMLYYESNGMVRWFSVLGAAAGMLLYKKTLSKPFVAAVSGVVNWLLERIGKFLHWLFTPLRSIYRKWKMHAARQRRKAQMRMRVHRRRVKKQLTVFREKIKMKLRTKREKKPERGDRHGKKKTGIS